MNSISIGDIQKDISLLTQLTDPLTIIDKCKNKIVAVIYPVNKHSVIASMAGKYKNRVQKCEDLKHAKESTMMQTMKEKHDLSD